MSCEYLANCWRCVYTRYLMDNQDYPETGPPNRRILFFKGYCSKEMATPKVDKKGKKKYKGLYAEVFPFPNDVSTFCPEMLSLPKTDCHEYKKQKKKEQRIAESKKNRLEKYPNKRKRVSIDSKTRKHVSKRDKYNCVYCNRNCTVLKSQGINCCVDHFIPLALGGDEKDIFNLVFSCVPCNRAKSDQIWEIGQRIGFYD